MAEKRFHSGSPSGFTPSSKKQRSLTVFSPSPKTTNLTPFVEGLSFGPDDSGIEEEYVQRIPRIISPVNRTSSQFSSPIISASEAGNIERALGGIRQDFSQLGKAVIDDTESGDESYGILEEFGVGVDPGVWVSPKRNEGFNYTPLKKTPQFNLFFSRTPTSEKKVRFEDELHKPVDDDDFPRFSPPRKPVDDDDFPRFSPPRKPVDDDDFPRLSSANMLPVSPSRIEEEFEEETSKVLRQTRPYISPTENMAKSLMGVNPQLAVNRISDDVRRIYSSYPSTKNTYPGKGSVRVVDNSGELAVYVNDDSNSRGWTRYTRNG